MDKQGCEAVDTLKLFVEKINTHVFVPNIFSPNNDQINDRWWISTDQDVVAIQSLSVFDRWGNMVFSANHIPPNDPAYAWDGKIGGTRLNPAVFAYKVIVKLRDGSTEILCGDVTIVR